MEICDLFTKIPRDKLDYLFSHSDAGAELDAEFLGFEDVYRKALDFISPDTVVIDLGCAYATQSWYFRECSKYIGVDSGSNRDSVIHTENSEYYFTSIQEFVRDILPKLGMNLDSIFAICSAVPDEEARQIVRDTFPNYLDWYPGEEMEICFDRRIIREKNREEEYEMFA